jgi:hypothetical protein
LSRVTDDQILNLSEAQNFRESTTNNSEATTLLHTIKAICKSVPYSDEAVTEARTKLFALRNYFGPPEVFFTIPQKMDAVSELNCFVIPPSNFYQN